LSLQDIAFSAQQALNQSPDDRVLSVDPALHTYANDDYHTNYATVEEPTFPTNGGTVMSSVECQANESMLMDGIEPTGHNSEPRGFGMDSVTPGPPSYKKNDKSNNKISTNHIHQNGFLSKPRNEEHAVRHPSSSPIFSHIPSPTRPFHNNITTIPTSPDLPPPTTPHPPRLLRGAPSLPSSAKKQTCTPSSTRRVSKTPKSAPGAARRHASTSKDAIKMECGRSSAAATATTTTADTLFGAVGAGMMHLGAQDPHLDQASRDLIKQLQQEDLGLRRRRRSSR